MRDIFRLERTTEILPDDSYIISYPYLVDYFASKSKIEVGDVVRGAHMVYGWMPTIVELYPEEGVSDLAKAADLLTRAKAASTLTLKEIGDLVGLVNNSVVGASKLLHFASPENYPIWDSKVYSFVHEKRPHHYRVNSAATYLDYIALLKRLTSKREFLDFHASINSKLGYPVSSLRALELVMFLNAPVYGG